jgi:putative transposase
MLFNVDLDKDLLHTIRTAANFSMPLGNDRFKAQIEQAFGRRVGQAKRGKPVTQQKTTKFGVEN